MQCRPLVILMLHAFLGTGVAQADAGACTYREALMALEQNNLARGLSLMRIAANDGDVRAAVFLSARSRELAGEMMVFESRVGLRVGGLLSEK